MCRPIGTAHLQTLEKDLLNSFGFQPSQKYILRPLWHAFLHAKAQLNITDKKLLVNE